MPGLLFGIDAVNLLLFSHLHVGFVALSEIVKLRGGEKHTHEFKYKKTVTNIFRNAKTRLAELK